MSASAKKSTKKNLNDLPAGATANDVEVEADVLFQRLYDKWYAFSVVDQDCLMTEVTEEEVEKRMATSKKLPRAS